MCSQSCGVLLAELGLEKQPRERFLEEKDYEFLFGYLRSVTVMLDETFFYKAGFLYNFSFETVSYSNDETFLKHEPLACKYRNQVTAMLKHHKQRTVMI